MVKPRPLSFVALSAWLFMLETSTALSQPIAFVKIENGVSASLASFRKRVLSGVNYQLSFTIPSLKTEAIPASETISFHLKAISGPLLIDFKEEKDHLKKVAVNGKEIPVHFRNEHIVIDQAFLKQGANSVAIQFTAGNLSLNRNNDYLYTLLVPDRARTVFPCFDQPDLKARFRLTLTVPSTWKALSNGPLQDTLLSDSSKTYRFAPSDPIPTYLFSFAAGRFEQHFKSIGGRPMHFYYRETDSIKIRLSRDTIYGLHADALRFLEGYTGISYPFQKFDFIAIPDFQYGGMEHVGAIDYRASVLFLDSGATKDQENARASLIGHETAHMWFGDLVTMQWFNDVWMKEVFANFMADKITQGAGGANSYELKFLLTHFPRAYSIDRTLGANPIRQPLANLQEAGTLYGPVIYNKAPVMMRQLERLMGQDPFRQGIWEYLRKYSFGNASWPDLIRILDKRTPADLAAWNHVWVNSPGRPHIKYSLQQEGNRIKKLTITQHGERGGTYNLPQFFEIALVYPDRVEEHTVNLSRQKVELPEVAGKGVPLYVVFNSSGQGYGIFPVDKKMLPFVGEWKNGIMRAAAYINLYENMLNGLTLTPDDLLQVYLPLLLKEPEELSLGLLTSQVTDVYWRLFSASKRNTIAPSLEGSFWNAMQKEEAANKKKLLFKAYQNIAITPESLSRLYAIWKTQVPPAGVKLAEEDFTSLALTLALKEHPADSILMQQLARISNADRKDRLRFLMPALSSNVEERDAFFASLRDKDIRKKEAWVADALVYLHHPLRASTSIHYLKESLQMLQEIQLTGDIFFPAAWLSASFGSYQSGKAAGIVTDFLKANPAYSPKLKAKILQATDPLFRAQRLVKE